MSNRLKWLKESEQRTLLTALEKWRSLSVDEACYLAEQYVIHSAPPRYRQSLRKSVPIMQRAFYACYNLTCWGSYQCH